MGFSGVGPVVVIFVVQGALVTTTPHETKSHEHGESDERQTAENAAYDRACLVSRTLDLDGLGREWLAGLCGGARDWYIMTCAQARRTRRSIIGGNYETHKLTHSWNGEMRRRDMKLCHCRRQSGESFWIKR